MAQGSLDVHESVCRTVHVRFGYCHFILCVPECPRQSISTVRVVVVTVSFSALTTFENRNDGENSDDRKHTSHYTGNDWDLRTVTAIGI